MGKFRFLNLFNVFNVDLVFLDILGNRRSFNGLFALLKNLNEIITRRYKCVVKFSHNLGKMANLKLGSFELHKTQPSRNFESPIPEKSNTTPIFIIQRPKKPKLINKKTWHSREHKNFQLIVVRADHLVVKIIWPKNTKLKLISFNESLLNVNVKFTIVSHYKFVKEFKLIGIFVT